MAENVELSLERMLPALQDLQKRQIFDEAEVRSMIEQRRTFEYKLQKRAAELGDYIRYLEYELKLERLRRLRMTRLRRRVAGLGADARAAAGTVRGEGDHAGVRHIHKLFERALRKFGQSSAGGTPGGPALWEQYATFAEREGAGKTLSRLFARALALHPQRVSLWVRAAEWEWRANGSAKSARTMLQRALRANGRNAPLLWHEYFRLELM
jgi:U3 small nucleolar RNA-associated protein 6